jgi:hypothetical protein
MYRTAGTTFIDCDYNKQHITQCTVGADQMFTDVYAISCQHTTVHTVTVPYQNNKPILHLTHFITTNNNCTISICTKQHWKVILTAYCLQSTDSQHSHCCSWPNNWLIAVHYTNTTTFVSQSRELKSFLCSLELNVALGAALCCCLTRLEFQREWLGFVAWFGIVCFWFGGWAIIR